MARLAWAAVRSSGAGELGRVTLLLDANRTELADTESMPFQFASFRDDAAKFVQIPKPASDLVDRTDDDFVAIAVDFVANRSLQSCQFACGAVMPGLDGFFRLRILRLAVSRIAPPA